MEMRRATKAPGAASRGKGRKATKATARPKRTNSPHIAQELEAANRRIRDLEELHRSIGARLDAAIATIHKILERAA
jgi:hypothetical protein